VASGGQSARLTNPVAASGLPHVTGGHGVEVVGQRAQALRPYSGPLPKPRASDGDRRVGGVVPCIVASAMAHYHEQCRPSKSFGAKKGTSDSRAG
jgi:hypothetical protein